MSIWSLECEKVKTKKRNTEGVIIDRLIKKQEPRRW